MHDQNADDFLDATDFIEFYGRPVAAQYAKYARDNVYWLVTAGGTGSPRRMADVDGAPAAGPVAPPTALPSIMSKMNTMWGWRREMIPWIAGFLMTLCWVPTLPAPPIRCRPAFPLTCRGSPDPAASRFPCGDIMIPIMRSKFG